MEKKIIDAMHWRYAVKTFDSKKKVSEKDLETLFEAMRLAPSSFGLQPWKFIVVSDKELREKLKAAAWNQSQITDASCIVIFCGKKDVDEKYIKRYIETIADARGISVSDLNGFEEMMLGWRKGFSHEAIAGWSKRQAYIPLGILLESAALMGIDACPMEGFDSKEFDKILELEDYSSVAVCALGYRSKDDKSAHAKKVRFCREEVFEFR